MKSRQISPKGLPKLSKQLTLHKYFPCLVNNPVKNLFYNLTTPIPPNSGQTHYHCELGPDDVIRITETHCLVCGTRLVKNGYNSRFVILDNCLGEYTLRIHRKRCPRCGEIPINIDRFAPKYGNYHENFKRKARDLYMKGHIPREIQDSFHTMMGQWVPISTIVGWINEIEEPLNALLIEEPLLSEGYLAYDEIHMRISGEKKYAIILLDVKTKTPILIKHVDLLDRSTAVDFLRTSRRGRKIEIKSIVKDGGTIFGNLFKTRSYKHIKVQLGLTHMKWNFTRYIKQYCGMWVESKKPLPPYARPIQDRFYRLIDSANETETYAAIEALRTLIIQKNNKYLTRGFTRLVSILPNITHWQRDIRIPKTNNLLERFNQYIQRNRSYKYHMKTLSGAQRVADYLSFPRIMRGLINQRLQLEINYRRWREIVKDPLETSLVKGQGRYFSARRKKIDDVIEHYMMFWQDNLKIL